MISVPKGPIFNFPHFFATFVSRARKCSMYKALKGLSHPLGYHFPHFFATFKPLALKKIIAYCVDIIKVTSVTRDHSFPKSVQVTVWRHHLYIHRVCNRKTVHTLEPVFILTRDCTPCNIAKCLKWKLFEGLIKSVQIYCTK